MNDTTTNIASYFPESMRTAILAACRDSNVEEIRIRINSQIQLVTATGERVLYGNRFFVDGELIKRLFEAFCMHSVYACEDEIKNGYVTLEGGARVGIAGRAVCYCDKIVRFCDISSFNVRIARERIGCADGIIGKIVAEHGTLCSTLVLSPPQAGKTTLLRDIARQLSQKHKVCIVDERSEIAGCVRGVPSCDVGMRTDVLDGTRKVVGIKMALRTLSPEVIITDEIGTKEDAMAVCEAITCGVAVIASAHSGDISRERVQKELLLLEDNIERIVKIDSLRGRRTYTVYAGLFGGVVA